MLTSGTCRVNASSNFCVFSITSFSRSIGWWVGARPGSGFDSSIAGYTTARKLSPVTPVAIFKQNNIDTVKNIFNVQNKKSACSFMKSWLMFLKDQASLTKLNEKKSSYCHPIH